MTTTQEPVLDEKGLEAAVAVGQSQGIRDNRKVAERISDAIRAYLASVAPAAVREDEAVAWQWRQLMHDSMGGWEEKFSRSGPGSWVKPEDIRDLRPLYTRPASPAPSVVDGDGYCTDCENRTTILNGRCACGSGRVIADSTTPAPSGVVEALRRMVDLYESEYDADALFVRPKWLVAALQSQPIAPAGEGIVTETAGAMTPEEIRLEDLKQMAAYDGPIVSFDVAEPYYLASCDHCGWVGSSGKCSTDSWGDYSDVYCPRCFASGADCGKVAAALTAALSKQEPVGGDAVERIAAILLGSVNAPEQEIYRVAREIAAIGKKSGWSPTHRHVKRGSEYEIIGQAQVQCSDGLTDYEVATVYRGKDGQLWVRRKSEFEDGRFEAIAAAPQQGAK